MDTGQFILDQDSSLLTTFNSPFRRYHFLQLPFGLVCSQDIFQKKDGSDPQRMPRMYQNCRQHHCTWLHWGRTWCLPTRSHANCPQIQLGVQPTEDTHEGPIHQFLWMPIWCQWCPPRPWKGWCCTHLTSTHQHHWASRNLRSSHIPKSLLSWSVYLDHPSMRAAQEGHRFQLELHIWHHFWVDQGSCCQWHHLRYFDPSLPMTIQVDASQVGLGAALLQNGKPIAFASKALTKTECWYTNRERERGASCCL